MSERCAVCGAPAQIRLRAATYPYRRGPLGWLIAALAWAPVRWQWACTEHVAAQMRAAVGTRRGEPDGGAR